MTVRRLAAALVLLPVLASVAACPREGNERPFGEVTDVDRARFETLRSDDFLRSVEVDGKPGHHRGDTDVERSHVYAESKSYGRLGPFLAAGKRHLKSAEKAGWTLYRAECTGRPARWNAWFYKKQAEGDRSVSYLMSITADHPEMADDVGRFVFEGWAPQVDENADLLPERPSRVGKPCVLAERASKKRTVQGMDVVFGNGGREGEPENGPTR